MILILILLIILLILYIFSLFCCYFAFFDNVLTYHLDVFSDKKLKYEYKKVKQTHLVKQLKFLIKNKNSIYSNKVINDNFIFLSKLASFIDNQILKSKLTYRSKENKIWIQK